VPAGALRRIYAAAADAPAVATLGLDAPLVALAPDSLAVAPLIAFADWLGTPAGHALVLASDRAGAGSAVVLSA
jgi:hypothetical protein